MATKHGSVVQSSPANGDSDDEAHDGLDENLQEEEEEEEEQEETKPISNVANILARLQSSGALIKKPKQEYRCFTCDEDFRDWEELEKHLIQHVSLPSVVLDKLPSDDEDGPLSGDENWTDEEEETPLPPSTPKTPQKMDISEILKKTGISLKKPNDTDSNNSNTALNKLSGLGFTIKKNNTPIKQEPETEQPKVDVLKKLGQLGGIKLKLKSDGNNSNSFKVVNGLKDFNPSDEEDEGSGMDEDKDVDNEDPDKSGEPEGSGGENDSDGEPKQTEPTSRKSSESDDSAKSPVKPISLKNLQGLSIKTSPSKISIKELEQTRPPGRPTVKQTPKRVTNVPVLATEQLNTENNSVQEKAQTQNVKKPDVERRESQDVSKVAVKEEIETVETPSSNVPIFANQIKSERASPPLADSISTPIIARVKTEPESSITAQTLSTNTTTPLLPVAKKEDQGVTIIEINGDSNDEDDDCCVVSATPAPDIKPIIPKTEKTPQTTTYSTTPSYTSSEPRFSSSGMLSSRLTAPSTEKQHTFNWNAPDSKPPLDMLAKSTDDIFESLLSSATKKENLLLSDASEYISLDTLGPKHTCDVCNTRFTDISLLEDHRRMTGHSNSIVIPPTSSTLMPYNPNSNILSSLLPVKQLADQVGKISTIGGGPGFTHQQNVMINIQAYPGAGGMMMPPQSYNSYPPGPAQNMRQDYSQSGSNMYGVPGTGPGMSGQYPGQNYGAGQHAYGQYPSGMPQTGYPGTMSQGQYPTSSPYSTASPLQSMQQTVYGQTPTSGMNTQMGPPGAPYSAASSPGGNLKPPSSNNIKIQNVQTFPVGQTIGQMLPPGQTIPGSDMGGHGGQAPGQGMSGQMPSPSQIRMAPGANITGARPRMVNPRGPRPSIRPGVHVQGQVRGQKQPMRMPMKRPAGGAVGTPSQKRRPDMLLPGKHDNEDCQVMAMQKQREGLPMIQSVQGAKDKLNFGSQISITKKTVNKEANAMANVLASRGISIRQKQKSRSPTPERPIPHIPNLGAGMSIKHTSKSSNFSIPEAKVGGGMNSCRICKKMFMNQNSLDIHMAASHGPKGPPFKCDECPASYPKSLQLQHHKRVFHNVSGPNRELGLPVVDLSQEDNLKRLSSLGIYSFIPLANKDQGNGCFGIPVISVHNVQNGLTSSLQALGADGLLSLGPLKPLPNS